jgi:hypothetical protein
LIISKSITTPSLDLTLKTVPLLNIKYCPLTPTNSLEKDFSLGKLRLLGFSGYLFTG